MNETGYECRNLLISSRSVVQVSHSFQTLTHNNVVHFQIDAKYDTSVEMDARKWIEDVLGEKVAWGSDEGSPGSGFADGLKSGEVLCKYVFFFKKKYMPEFLKTGLAKMRTHSTSWQLKTIQFVQRPINLLTKQEVCIGES